MQNFYEHATRPADADWVAGWPISCSAGKADRRAGVLLNLAAGSSQTAHLLAKSPAPRVDGRMRGALVVRRRPIARRLGLRWWRGPALERGLALESLLLSRLG